MQILYISDAACISVYWPCFSWKYARVLNSSIILIFASHMHSASRIQCIPRILHHTLNTLFLFCTVLFFWVLNIFFCSDRRRKKRQSCWNKKFKISTRCNDDNNHQSEGSSQSYPVGFQIVIFQIVKLLRCFRERQIIWHDMIHALRKLSMWREGKTIELLELHVKFLASHSMASKIENRPQCLPSFSRWGVKAEQESGVMRSKHLGELCMLLHL